MPPPPQHQAYISFADYMRGNQDQIAASNQQIGDAALASLNTEVDKYHKAADDAAAWGTDPATRELMDQQAGIDTGDAYRKYQDEVATRAAHPDLAWQTPAGQAPDPAVANQFGWAVDSAGKPLPGTGTNNTAANPYGLNADPFTTEQLRNAMAGTDYGKGVQTAQAGAEQKGMEAGNLDNWGGVFDAYKTLNKGTGGYGNAGAMFDATVAGRGLHDAAQSAKDTVKGLPDYYNKAIDSNRGGDDQQYGGVDRYAVPEDKKPGAPTGGYGVGEGNQIDYGQPQTNPGPPNRDNSGNTGPGEGGMTNYNDTPGGAPTPPPTTNPDPWDWRNSGGG